MVIIVSFTTRLLAKIWELGVQILQWGFGPINLGRSEACFPSPTLPSENFKNCSFLDPQFFFFWRKGGGGWFNICVLIELLNFIIWQDFPDHSSCY